MKTLSFDYDEKDELVIVSDASGVLETLYHIKSMFDKKAWLTENGWTNAKINGVRCWYLPETPAEKAELMVAVHDFYYYQIDNIDMFLDGERHLAKVDERLSVLPASDAVALWNKYAPKELHKALPA